MRGYTIARDFVLPQLSAFLLFLLFFCVHKLSGQSQGEEYSCGMPKQLERYRLEQGERYDQLLADYDRFLSEISAQAARQKNEKSSADPCPNGISVIPIAFQLFHRGEAIGQGHNFSPEQLIRVVDQLNEDFSGYNALRNGITGEFIHYDGGHSCIQFAIGKINRINYNDLALADQHATHTVLQRFLPGGSGQGSANDPRDFLNIYSADLGQGFLGIASSIPRLYGLVNAADDGVTIHWDVLVPGMYPNSVYNRGGVLSHELGHWLGLPHVNGDHKGGGCGMDDGFSDTYPQSSLRYYSCQNPKIPESCGTPDNVFNFMDYSYDCAKLMFSYEQIAAMNEILRTDRFWLTESYLRGNADEELYPLQTDHKKSHKLFFEVLNLDCKGEINLLTFLERWFSCDDNPGVTKGGLDIYYWELRQAGKSRILGGIEMARAGLTHSGSYQTSLAVLQLNRRRWNPYKRKYGDAEKLAIVMVSLQQCQPPLNDKIENALPLHFSDACRQSFSLYKATASANTPFACKLDTLPGDVWFKIQVQESGRISLRLSSMDPSGAPPLAELFSSLALSGDQLHCLKIVDDGNAELFNLIPGSWLYIRVYNRDSGFHEQFTICASEPAISNDNCPNATVLHVGNVCQRYRFSVSGASVSSAPIPRLSCGANPYISDVWFALRTPEYGELSIQAMHSENGLSSLVMELYHGDCEDLQPLNCSSTGSPDPSAAELARMQLSDLEPGEILYLRVAAQENSGDGSFELCLTNYVQDESCKIGLIENSGQSECEPGSNTFDQNLILHYSGRADYAYVNNTRIVLTGSPQPITISKLPANGKTINLYAALSSDRNPDCWSTSFYEAREFIVAPTSCYEGILLNDECTDAIELTVSEYCHIDTFSNVGASFSEGFSEYFECGNSGYRPQDVWFSFIVPASGNVEVLSPLFFNENNMIMELYSGSCDGFRLIACDQFSSAVGSIIHLRNRTPGEKLWIRICDQRSDTEGLFGICLTDPGPNSAGYVAEHGFNESKHGPSGQNTHSEDLLLYPNPLCGESFTLFSRSGSLNAGRILLFSAEGRQLIPEQNCTDETQCQISLKAYPEGLYYLVIQSGEGAIVRKLIRSCS